MISEASRKGLITETHFELECYNKNITVSKPTNNSSPYDAIVDVNGKLCKVQIKYSNFRDCNGPRLNIGNKYKVNDFDYLAVYVEHYRDWFIIPFAEVPKSGIRLNKKYQKYKNNWSFE